MKPPKDRAELIARTFWNWFQTAPHNECRDADCIAKLAEMIRDEQEDVLDAVLFHHDVPDFRMEAIREMMTSPLYEPIE
jgi:hypothetical protein